MSESSQHTDTIRMAGMRRADPGATPPPPPSGNTPSYEDIFTMIRCHVSEHASAMPHDRVPERPCEHHRTASRWVIWAIGGLTAAMLLAVSMLSGQDNGLASTQREVSTLLKTIEIRQSKTDSDMEYIKNTMREIREDIRGRKP